MKQQSATYLRDKIENIFDKHRVAYTRTDDVEVNFDINVIDTYEATNSILSLFKEEVEKQVIGANEEENDPRSRLGADFYNHLRMEQRQKLQEITK